MAVLPLSAWENFYVIVGSSAGALTGLLFVVITLLVGRPAETTRWGVGAFTSPTIVQFGVVLFVAALLSAPWPSLTPPALLLGLASVAGMGYAVIVVRRLRQRLGYQPVGEDWLWFVALPLVADIALLVAALLLPGSPVVALFATGAAVLLLLFVGIRNAWDLVTYIAIERFAPDNEPDKADTDASERDAGDASAE
jgi:hypothetical protein